MMIKIKPICLAVVSALALAGCSDSATNNSADKKLAEKITELSLTGDPTTGRTLPDITDAKAQLGMKLFYTKGLGGDQDSACVSCHHPVLGGGDNLSLSIGVEAEVPDWLGEGRRHRADGHDFDGGPTVPRNAPTTFNVALWDQALFHDGRVETVATGGIRTPDSEFGVADPDAGANLAVAQSRFPVTSAEEMRGHTFEAGSTNAELRAALQARMDGTSVAVVDVMPSNNWQAEFDAAFGAPTAITFPVIADAIGEYENTQVFVDNAWKAYVEGDNQALSKEAKAGALLFFNSAADGGANCANCHSGDFFTDEGFHVVAMPQVGRGKGNGPNGTDDFGRMRESGAADDKYAFRTPSLLNTEVYGPWGHAGGYTSLEAVVKHHSNPQAAIDNYDFNQIDNSIQAEDMKENSQLAVDQLAANRIAGTISPILEDGNLTDEEVSQIVMFLKSLTDPCVLSRDCLAPWIPNASDTNPDGLRVNAVDGTGSTL